MVDAIHSYLTTTLAGIRVADVIDMLLAAGFIYGLIHWLRRSSSPRLAHRIVLSVVILAALYILASLLDMVLLETIVLISFLLVGVGTAVFFQKDIQRTLDRILLLRFQRLSDRPSLLLSPVNILCEAAGVLAEKRHGALIAIHGKEAWSRQIEGGVWLDGIVSVPLLLSLFDPASAGHDGAVLLKGDIVTQFGAHLPLSAAGPLKGTRHAAGLGLSERCDAFVIIVSEERGTISVARHGTLSEVASPTELKRLLAPFWADHYQAIVPVLSRWKRLRPVAMPLLSLVLAMLLWILFASRPQEAIQTFTVPIEYVNVPPAYELTDPGPASALVTLSGSEQAFRIFNPSALIVSMDLSGIEEGTNRLPITESDIRIPQGWTLYRVEPEEVVVEARVRAPKGSP